MYMSNFWCEYRSWPWLEKHKMNFWQVKVQGHMRHIADHLWVTSIAPSLLSSYIRPRAYSVNGKHGIFIRGRGEGVGFGLSIVNSKASIYVLVNLAYLYLGTNTRTYNIKWLHLSAIMHEVSKIFKTDAEGPHDAQQIRNIALKRLEIAERLSRTLNVITTAAIRQAVYTSINSC